MYLRILKTVMPVITVAALHHKLNVKIDSALSRDKKIGHKKDVENNQGKISVLNTIIDFEAFKKVHPGGEAVLDPRMSGHDVTHLMQKHVPFHFQHGVISTLNDLINKHEVAKGTLPSLPSDVENAIARKLHDETIGPNDMDHGGGNKEPILKGDYSTFFNKDGTTPNYFRRGHGPEQGNPNEVIIEGIDGKTRVINRARMVEREDLVEVTKPIICAGASRSGYIKDGKKVSGISWGKQEVMADGHIKQGADAIGNVSFNVLPLSTLVESDNKYLRSLLELLSYAGWPVLEADKNFVYILEGSDGYKAAIHSCELKQAFWDPSENRALIDGPGFRQIKKLARITVRDEMSEEELSRVLEDRLGSPMKMLEGYVRQILAACPEYDAYVLREEASKPPFGFNHKMPPSIKVWQQKEEDGQIKIKALVFGSFSASTIRAVIQKQSERPREQAFDIQFFPNSDSMGMVDISLPSEGVEKVTLKANTSSNEHYFTGDNRRGLYYLAEPQTLTFKSRGSHDGICIANDIETVFANYH